MGSCTGESTRTLRSSWIGPDTSYIPCVLLVNHRPNGIITSVDTHGAKTASSAGPIDRLDGKGLGQGRSVPPVSPLRVLGLIVARRLLPLVVVRNGRYLWRLWLPQQKRTLPRQRVSCTRGILAQRITLRSHTTASFSGRIMVCRRDQRSAR